jgi:hypothetical protein
MLASIALQTGLFLLLIPGVPVGRNKTLPAIYVIPACAGMTLSSLVGGTEQGFKIGESIKTALVFFAFA